MLCTFLELIPFDAGNKVRVFNAEDHMMLKHILSGLRLAMRLVLYNCTCTKGWHYLIAHECHYRIGCNNYAKEDKLKWMFFQSIASNFMAIKLCIMIKT